MSQVFTLRTARDTAQVKLVVYLLANQLQYFLDNRIALVVFQRILSQMSIAQTCLTVFRYLRRYKTRFL